MEYDYQHALAAQHGLQLANNHQLHPQMQIPMQLAAGLNLTVMPTSAMQGQQHHQLGLQQGQHILYQHVQPAQNATAHVTHHQQQPQAQQNHHQNHHQAVNQGHGGHGHGHGNQQQTHGKGKKKPKVNKDGVPAPKRATTAYINFTQWYREELKKTGRPIPKIGEFGKECAAKWNSMVEEDKKPFLDVASKDRDRYKREMAVFKPARDANKPKRPGTAFMLFMGDFRKEMAGKEPEGGVAALAKLGGERWRNMTEEDKRPYVEKQNEEKQRYEVAMEEYRRKTGISAPGVTTTSDSSRVDGQTSESGGGDAPAADDHQSKVVQKTDGNNDDGSNTIQNNGGDAANQQQQTVVTSIPLTIYSSGGQLFAATGAGQFTPVVSNNNGTFTVQTVEGSGQQGTEQAQQQASQVYTSQGGNNNSTTTTYTQYYM